MYFPPMVNTNYHRSTTIEVYLAIAPAPLNEPLWDSEDSPLSEMSSQETREWALEDSRWKAQDHQHIRYTTKVQKNVSSWWLSDLLSPFSMTASSSSGVLLDKRCLVKRDFSLQTFAMLSCPALLACRTQIQREKNTLLLQHSNIS